MGLTYPCSACPFVQHAQSGRLRSCEPAEQQEASRQQRATECRCEPSEWLLQDIRDYQVEPRTPAVGRFRAEVDSDWVCVQGRVRFGTGQRTWIDVGTHDEVSASGPGDPGKHPRTRTDVQNRSRLALPAKQVHCPGAQTRRRVGSVPEDRGTCCFLRKLG
jgi:hypothetical protein